MFKKTIMILLFVSFLITVGIACHAADKKVISIATGGTAGTYYAIGGGMAKLVSKYMPG